MTIETEREADGRWLAEVPEIAGALAYGPTRKQTIAHAQALALRVITAGRGGAGFGERLIGEPKATLGVNETGRDYPRPLLLFLFQHVNLQQR